jgi:hypothetical protein
MLRGWHAAAALASAIAFASAAGAEDAAAPVKGVEKDGIVTVDTWNARYCEFLVIKGSVLKFEADVYNTLTLNTCPQSDLEAVDVDAVKAAFGARAVFKNGPRYWVVSALSSHATSHAAPVATFGDLEARLVGVVQLPFGMHRAPEPYHDTTIKRDTRYGYPAGRPVFILDDPKGGAWVMQAYSQIVDPTLSLDDLAGLGARLKLPAGWSFRTETLDHDLAVQPVDGIARIVQDDLENTYDLCFDTACSFEP